MILKYNDYLYEKSQLTYSYRYKGENGIKIEDWLKKYPKVKISMEKFMTIKDMRKAYNQFLKELDMFGKDWGFEELGKSEKYKEYTHYNYDMPKLTKSNNEIGFADIFQYLYVKNNPNYKLEF